MKFSIAAMVGALAATVFAKPAFTNLSFDVEEGKPFTLNWVNATSAVTIVLIKGPTAGTMVPVETLVSGLTGTSFTYTPSNLTSGRYAFRIHDKESETDPNFSAAFNYIGTAVSSSATITSSATLSATTSAATETETETETDTKTTMSTTSTRPQATTTPRPTQAPTNNNNAQRFSSPLALVIITVAALVFFN